MSLWIILNWKRKTFLPQWQIFFPFLLECWPLTRVSQPVLWHPKALQSGCPTHPESKTVPCEYLSLVRVTSTFSFCEAVETCWFQALSNCVNKFSIRSCSSVINSSFSLLDSIESTKFLRNVSTRCSHWATLIRKSSTSSMLQTLLVLLQKFLYKRLSKKRNVLYIK